MIKLKRLVEKHFQDNWDATPIHFFGSDFNSSNIDEWVQLRFSPESSTIDDSKAYCNTERAFVEIYGYADDLRSALSLADTATKTMRQSDDFSIESRVQFEQNTFDNKTWFVNARMNIVLPLGELPTPAINNLIDDSGNFLVDGLGNTLTV